MISCAYTLDLEVYVFVVMCISYVRTCAVVHLHNIV